jgi:hypothetical protein
MRNMIIATACALAGCGAPPAQEGNASAAAGEPATPSSEAVPAPVPTLPKVTMVEVNRLRTGMTYAEVKVLLGRDGYLGASERGTQIYAWTNMDGGSLQATFEDGKLQDKVDFGIK